MLVFKSGFGDQTAFRDDDDAGLDDRRVCVESMPADVHILKWEGV